MINVVHTTMSAKYFGPLVMADMRLIKFSEPGTIRQARIHNREASKERKPNKHGMKV
jgi:hypothetical protein